jgi:F0F1-type ATP synthase delta subunit
LERVETELLAFRDLVQKNKGFNSFLSNPAIPRGEKVEKVKFNLSFTFHLFIYLFIYLFFRQLSNLIEESKFSHISRNLLLIMASNGRSQDVSKVVSVFEGNFFLNFAN